jgi:hypothetical protein
VTKTGHGRPLTAAMIRGLRWCDGADGQAPSSRTLDALRDRGLITHYSTVTDAGHDVLSRTAPALKDTEDGARPSGRARSAMPDQTHRLRSPG